MLRNAYKGGGCQNFLRKKRYEGVRFVSEIKVVYFWSKSDSVHSDLKHTYAENYFDIFWNAVESFVYGHLTSMFTSLVCSPH